MPAGWNIRVTTFDSEGKPQVRNSLAYEPLKEPSRWFVRGPRKTKGEGAPFENNQMGTRNQMVVEVPILSRFALITGIFFKQSAVRHTAEFFLDAGATNLN